MTASDPLAKEAAAWVARLNSDQVTEADRRAFRRWVEADPARGRAYSEAATIWEGVGALAHDSSARALLWNGAPPRAARPWRALRVAAVGAAAAAAAVLATLTWLEVAPAGPSYSTGPGRSRTVQLADGSIVTLDGATTLRTRFTAGERRLVLARGRAFFRVAKDRSRPFRVFVGADEVRAVGTAFQVRRVGDHAQVVLEEGRLAVYQGSRVARTLGGLSPSLPLRAAHDDIARTPNLMMVAGQEVRLGAAAQPVLEKANIPQTSAWRYGRLVFDATPLAQVAEDLNATDVGPRIVLGDPALASIRVSGVFHAGRPRDVVASVSAAFPVQVASDDGAKIVLAPR